MHRRLDGSFMNPSTGNVTAPFHSLNGSSDSSNGFWSQHRGDLSYNQLQKFWLEMTPQARRNLLRIDKQTLFEHARKNMYCSRCNGLLLEGFLQIVMYGKSLQQDAVGDPHNVRATDNQINGDLCMDDGCHDDTQDPSVHPWGGLTAAKDGTLTLLDCYMNSKSLKGLENVFGSAQARERERELLYPDACGGGGRGWISQGIAGYGRGHGTRETCALHTARLSVETLVDFWSALGEETRLSLLRMKEEDFIERLMYRFDSKRFCRDCRRNVIREFKELKELKRMRRETRCTSWFCVADTAFQYEVSRDTVHVDWHQTFSDAFGTYHHFEWAIGTAEGKSDILEFANVGLKWKVQAHGLDLSGLNACYITLRAWKMDGRCNELYVKAHALRGQQCVHCRLVVGDGFVTITRGEGITRFFEHAEEAEEEEDDDFVDKDGNELDGECSRPQKHAKSPELAREFLLDAATVEKAFREGTARQNAHSIFVYLALKLVEERVHVACKEIITLEKQMKLLEEEEKEKREEEERKSVKEYRRAKEREKKLRRKERLREKENREKKCTESHLNSVVDVVSKDEPTTPIDEGVSIASGRDSRESLSGRCEDNPSSPLSPDIQDDQLLTGYTYSNMDNSTEDKLDEEFGNTRDWNSSYPCDHFKYSRRKLKFCKNSDRDLNSKLSDRRKDATLLENGVVNSKYESSYHADGFELTKNFNAFNKQFRTNGAKSNVRNGSKFSEKFKWSNSRTCDKFAPYSCRCDHHHEFRSRPESHIVRVVKDPKYVNKSESPAYVSKPYYRSKRYTQAQCAREITGQPKGKIAGNPLTMKKVWEPLESQKKCVRSNSDSGVTLKCTSKVEVSESEQLLDCCSSCSGEVADNSVQTDHKDNDPTDLPRSRAKSCVEINNDFQTYENSHHYSKEGAAEDGELCSTKRSTLGKVGSSVSTSSNSGNCSSCLSEGDSNAYSNHQNLGSTSTSDSEESSQNSEGRETSHNIGVGITASLSVVEDQCKLTELDATSEGPASEGTKPSSFLKKSAPCFESGRENLTTSAQPQSVLPQMHNQSINYPVFQSPIASYYHQTPVWPVGHTNGLISYPPTNHYLFANGFGYGLNGNARLMQYGTLQPLPPSLHNRAHFPIFQQVIGVDAKETAKVAQLTSLKAVQHTTQKMDPTNQPPAVVDPKERGKLEKMAMGNDGFSLFHFGGPVALSTGFQTDQATVEEGIMGNTHLYDGDMLCSKKDSVEEYNLFAANNGIKVSIF
ncbi:hypothetical protein SASPL_111246 [Salvia splendens]|uniref:Stress response protein NST1 n=1 Tax=Salvia splendens TaxID=180675 RepID=A0A8X9A277_SALSN|nr:hypothetical protein SASPL_111246 [Salvia splendens]